MSGQGEITIALAGDVMLGRLVNESLERTGPAYPWGGLVP
jgi:poly-gamma-glutamate synthesis protein (capsule biosynthesis protein)